MTVERLYELFDEKNDEYGKFERVETKFSKRPDLHAFILIDNLLPAKDDEDMIVSATRDQFYLSPDAEDLAPLISEPQVIDLIRCGIMLDGFGEGFSMFA